MIDAVQIDHHWYQPSFVETFREAGATVQPSGCWKTHFAFDGPLNRTLASNGELEFYMDAAYAGTAARPLGVNPFTRLDGRLAIMAAPAPPALRARIYDRPYTSGLLTTQDCFSQTYGYFELRAKLPAGRGLWPAFWLLPTDRSWPPEIDVMEVLGDNPHRIYLTPHWTDARGVHQGAQFSPINESGTYDGIDTADGFHSYGLRWTRDQLSWMVDGRVVHTAPNHIDKPMYMLVNLAVGGQWPGNPDASTRFPAALEIDWIKAYREVP